MDVFWISVAGDDDLFLGPNEGIEGVEEFFLRALLAVEELDVVDQQQVERVVEALEGIEGLLLQGTNKIRYVISGMYVTNTRRGIGEKNRIADSIREINKTGKSWR